MPDYSLFQRVLLLEDEPAHAMLVKRALREYVGEIADAQTLAAALEKLPRLNPDLIISDIHLPDSSSVSHVRDLSSRSGGVPIIVLTSSNSLQDAVEAMKLGARDFIVKNFEGDFKEALVFSLSRIHASVLIEAEKTELQRKLQVLRVAIENSNDGLAVVDSDLKTAYSNRSFDTFVKLCGGQSGGLLELFSQEVNNAAALQGKLEHNLRELLPGSVWSTEVTFSSDKARAFDFSLSVVEPQGDRELPGREFVIWVRDITEEKRRQKFQREILSTTTHDLKGPLGAISLSAELMRDMLKGQEKPFELALRVESSARSALNLIDEFLSARRIQEGTFILKPAIQEIDAAAADVIREFSAQAAAKKLEVSYCCQPPDLKWQLDRLGFVRVLSNILSNAVKFTPRGGKIEISISAADAGLCLRVADNGSGMEPSEVQKIFDRFSRLEKHSDTAGSGLGLFVVKSVVTAHGGKIEVTSKAGHGTAFSVYFPAHPPVNERGELISLDFA